MTSNLTNHTEYILVARPGLWRYVVPCQQASPAAKRCVAVHAGALGSFFLLAFRCFDVVSTDIYDETDISYDELTSRVLACPSFIDCFCTILLLLCGFLTGGAKHLPRLRLGGKRGTGDRSLVWRLRGSGPRVCDEGLDLRVGSFYGLRGNKKLPPQPQSPPAGRWKTAVQYEQSFGAISTYKCRTV